MPTPDIAHVIQLSVSPVFLLMALGTFLAVLSGRLSRIIDRTRALEARDTKPNDPELELLRRRRWLVNRAITSGTFAALCVCVLISCAFVGALAKVDLGYVLAALFIVAMLAFIAVLVAFLAEIRLAIESATLPRA